MDKTHGRRYKVSVTIYALLLTTVLGECIERGFNNFLIKDYERSLIRYLEGSEMGYEVAQSNAAYILDRLYVDENSIAEDTNVIRSHTNDDHVKKIYSSWLYFFTKS